MPQLSQELDLPGVAPARQKRSRETTLRLLAAGAEMLRTRSLAELSIEALCAEVGATVGAFYSRFESKEAYFNALMALAARDGERRVAEMAADRSGRDADLASRCRQLIGGLIAWMRAHEGVLRAALQHDENSPVPIPNAPPLFCFRPWARAAAPPRAAPSRSAFRSSWARWSMRSSTIPARCRCMMAS
jgi:AcrR family transcriptional regulator